MTDRMRDIAKEVARYEIRQFSLIHLDYDPDNPVEDKRPRDRIEYVDQQMQREARWREWRRGKLWVWVFAMGATGAGWIVSPWAQILLRQWGLLP